ncbi:MAG: type IV toxin-antitoxin system AbiEi family antitoxin domain-containing protein [Archangium sp.]
MTNWAAAEQVAKRQFGLITRSQCEGCGLAVSSLKRAVGSGRLRAVVRGVYRFAIVRETWEQRAFVPQLLRPDVVSLSHKTAAWVYRLAGIRQPVRLDVKIPRSIELEIPGVQVHHVRDFAPPRRVGPFHVTGVGETILDLAGVLDARDLSFAFDSATRSHPREMSALFEYVSTRELRGQQGVVALRQMFAQRHGVILESPLESRVWTVLSRSGLPEPRTQRHVQDVMRVDFVWDDERVIVHCDSRAFHSSRAELENDARQRNHLAADWVSFVVTHGSVEGGEWLKLLRDALQRRAPQLRPGLEDEKQPE